ncbi:MAG: response regulator [Actinomycetales bacterium]|nr:response regulator [Actinomycetales bacterium]
MTSKPVRVLIVEDHPIFAAGLAALLETHPDIVVVGIASDGPEALELASRLSDIDVVLMDLNLPSMSGVEVTAQLATGTDPPVVLVITMVDDDDTVMAALRSGARGYVLKDATGDQIVSAIRAVADGGAVFGPGIATRVLEHSSRGSAPGPADGLTDRERQVLNRIKVGASNAQIARELGLSLKTVQNYVSRVLDKLQVTDRTQAALKASDPSQG